MGVNISQSDQASSRRSRPRVLLIAEAANPEWPSVPLVGWSHSQAIARQTSCHIVTQIRNRAAIERAGVDLSQFTFIDSEKIAKPVHRVASIVRGGGGKGWTTVTALQSLVYPYFESLVWRRFGNRLRNGEFDLVHRITPLSPTISSPLAKRLARMGVPFIIGPLNGGVAWPRAFDQARRRENEWLSYVRDLHKLLPGYRATRRYASLIICGSTATMAQVPRAFAPKCVYLPENGIDLTRFPDPGPKLIEDSLRLIFVGRLVPYKGADMLIEAVAPFIRNKQVSLEIVGDGPEMPSLRELVSRQSLNSGVSFSGWIPHEQLFTRFAHAHILGFPSIREFGGGVVLEAMSQRVVPVVVDYGGPGDLVTAQTGVAVPMTNRAGIISGINRAIGGLLDCPGRIVEMGSKARERVTQEFSWDAKAKRVIELYRRVLA